MLRSIYILLSLLFVSCFVFAQDEASSIHNDQGMIEGTVFTLENGAKQSLQGVQVNISSGESSILTREDGSFELEWPGTESWIRLSYPGYAEKQLLLNEAGKYNFVLFKEETKSSDQSVPGPFGQIQKYKNASFGLLKADELKNSTETSFETTLQGRLPGIASQSLSGMPGAGGLLRIRGLYSLFAVEQPLVVVDGIPIHSQVLGSNVTPGAVYNPLSVIDLNDIASIELYRDGNSVYGFHGSQGLIRISTMQPDVVNTLINFSLYSGITFQPDFLPVLNSLEYKNYLLNLLQGSGMKPGDITRENPWISGNPSYYYYYNYANDTNWQDEIMHAARVNKYNVSLQGGDEIARFSVSLGYLDQEGVVINSGFQRYNFRLNSRLQILQGLYMEANLGYSYHISNLVNGSTDYRLNPVNAALLKAPMLAPNLRDNLGNQISLLGDTDAYGFSNPAAIVENVESGRFGSDLFAGTKLTYEFSTDWNISSVVNLNYTSLKENAFIPDYGIGDFAEGEIKNIAKEGISKLNGFVSESRLNYTKVFDQTHFVNAYTGFRASTFRMNYLEGNAFNTPTDEFKSLSSVSSIENTLIFGNNRSENRSEWLLHGDYRFKDRFLASLVLNLAGTSNSGSTADAIDLFGGKFGFFPALNLAWLVSSERFLKKTDWLDLLKLRAGISWVGNDFYTNYNRFSYTSQPYGTNSSIVRNYLPNPDLMWETVRQVNIGLDLAFWQERAQFGIDVYQHKTKDLLTYRDLPAEAGNTLYWENNGSLNTNGVDMALSAKVINSRHFKLTIGATSSFHRSTLELENELFIQTLGGGMILADGQAPYSFFGLKTDGIYIDEEAASVAGLVNENGLSYSAGDIRFIDQNEDGIINNDDFTNLGSIFPDYDGGLFLNLEFWRFQLSIYSDFKYGNKIYNYQRFLLESQSGFANQSIASLYSWKYDGFETSNPKAVFGDPIGNNAFSDRWIEDGSYFRIKQLTFSYRFPDSRIYKNLNIYLTGMNLITLSNYLGYHPDFNYSTDPVLWGTDFGQVPLSPSVVLGVKVDL